ncbi:MAG: hypothetical protein ACRDFW_00455 [bacterium]
MVVDTLQQPLIAIARKHWKQLAATAFAASALALGASRMAPKTFTSTASFVPEKEGPSQLPSGLSSLAGQLGITTDDARNSPQFYAKVLGSRALRLAVANDTSRQDDSPSRTIGEALGCTGSNPEKFAECAVRKLDARTRVVIDPRSQVVTLAVGARHSRLAQEIATSYLRALSDFNLSLRQSNAGVRREFLQKRADEAQDLLADAEDVLKSFHARNRRIEDSPALLVEEGRLRRAIDRRQEIFLFLMRQLEQAKLDEVRNTPVITVVDRPNRPYRRSAPKTLVWMALAGFLGAAGHLLWLVRPPDAVPRAA